MTLDIWHWKRIQSSSLSQADRELVRRHQWIHRPIQLGRHQEKCCWTLLDTFDGSQRRNQNNLPIKNHQLASNFFRQSVMLILPDIKMIIFQSIIETLGWDFDSSNQEVFLISEFKLGLLEHKTRASLNYFFPNQISEFASNFCKQALSNACSI